MHKDQKTNSKALSSDTQYELPPGSPSSGQESEKIFLDHRVSHMQIDPEQNCARQGPLASHRERLMLYISVFYAIRAKRNAAQSRGKGKVLHLRRELHS